VRAIKEVVKQSKEAALSTGLVINESKTKYMKINKYNKCTERSDNRWTGIRRGQSFRYLGTLINSKNVISEEIKLELLKVIYVSII
jgi:hypothetical protein